MVRGQRMRFRVATPGADGSVAIACVTGSCSTDTSLSASQGVAIGGAARVDFNTLGEPVDNSGTPLGAAVTFTVGFTADGNTDSYNVIVAPLTGRVSVTRSP
jgi:hypothetical protein